MAPPEYADFADRFAADVVSFCVLAPAGPGAVISFRRMAEPTYTSRIHIDRVKGPIRHAYVTPFTEPIRFGVHGAIKQFYGVEPDEELPATLDHIIAAVGG